MRFLSCDDRLVNYGRWGNVTRLTYLTIQWELLQSTVAKHTVLCLAEWKFRIRPTLIRSMEQKRNKNKTPNECLCVGATTVKYCLTGNHFFFFLRIQIREYSISLKFLLFTPRKNENLYHQNIHLNTKWNIRLKYQDFQNWIKVVLYAPIRYLLSRSSQQQSELKCGAASRRALDLVYVAKSSKKPKKRYIRTDMCGRYALGTVCESHLKYASNCLPSLTPLVDWEFAWAIQQDGSQPRIGHIAPRCRGFTWKPDALWNDLVCRG